MSEHLSDTDDDNSFDFDFDLDVDIVDIVDIDVVDFVDDKIDVDVDVDLDVPVHNIHRFAGSCCSSYFYYSDSSYIHPKYGSYLDELGMLCFHRFQLR